MIIKNVILYPGEIRSKYDGDRHFISASQLARLYGVLPTDNVIIATSIKSLVGHGLTLDRIKREQWYELSPRYDGKYENIHGNDYVVEMLKIVPFTINRKIKSRIKGLKI